MNKQKRAARAKKKAKYNRLLRADRKLPKTQRTFKDETCVEKMERLNKIRARMIARAAKIKKEREERQQNDHP